MLSALKARDYDCSLLKGSKAASHCHYYFDLCMLGRPSRKWIFTSVSIFVSTLWQIFCSSRVYSKSTGFPPWTVFDGEFWETLTFLFIYCIYCILFKYKLTEIFCWVNSWLFQGKLGEISCPTSFLRNSLVGNQDQTSSDKKLCNYF